MRDGTLLLGPVLFQDFEIPQRIGFGGTQRLAVHRLPGGSRVIDALGRDDGDIAWSGVFSGPDAAARARRLDELRAAGLPLSLTWNAFFYSVVIASFDADYARSTWIPYRLACTVLRDEAAAFATLAVPLADSALADLSAAAIGLDTAVAKSAIAAPGATTAGTAAWRAAGTALAASVAVATATVTATDASLSAATPMTAAGLAAAADTAGQLATTLAARAYALRAQAALAATST